MKTILTRLTKGLPGLALGGILLATAAAVAFEQKPTSKHRASAAPPAVAVDERPVQREGKVIGSFSPVVKKVGPSVVKVYTVMKAHRTGRGEMPEGGLPMPPWLFGNPFEGQSRGRSMPMPPQHGVGSGVIVTKDGYILTNNHVVDGADEVNVTLLDKREFTAKVVGRDPKTDIAVLKIDAKDLPALPMADSEKIEVGDIVLAVGNPFNVGQTVTMGMVSAKGRGGVGVDYEDFIQTDAAINPGNSGGALVDSEGRLVGINTAILSRSGGNQGIGFAIPSDLAREVMDSLVKDGRVTRGYLGVMIQDVTPALAKEFKLKDESGALVSDVVPDGPADKAGFKSGDVVLEMAGKPVVDSRHLRLQVAHLRPGVSVAARVLRDGQTKELRVAVKELPGSESLARNESPEAGQQDALHGVAVTDLDANTRAELNVPARIKGALISQVEPGSASAEAGLKPGDVIVEINRQPVRNAEDAERLTQHPKDRSTLVRVWRNGGTSYAVVDESKGDKRNSG